MATWILIIWTLLNPFLEERQFSKPEKFIEIEKTVYEYKYSYRGRSFKKKRIIERGNSIFFKFDLKGRLVFFEEYYCPNRIKGCLYREKKTYKYDEFSRVSYSESWRPATNQPYYYSYFYYNQKGQLIKEKMYTIKDSSLFIKDDFFYDTRGNEIKHVVTTEPLFAKEDSSKTTYLKVFDELNRKKEMTRIVKGETQDWVDYTTYTYSNDTVFIKRIDSDSKESKSRHYQTQDSINQPIFKYSKYGSTSGSHSQYIEFYTYSAKGILSKVSENKVKTHWLPDSLDEETGYKDHFIEYKVKHRRLIEKLSREEQREFAINVNKTLLSPIY